MPPERQSLLGPGPGLPIRAGTATGWYQQGDGGTRVVMEGHGPRTTVPEPEPEPGQQPQIGAGDEMLSFFEFPASADDNSPYYDDAKRQWLGKFAREAQYHRNDSLGDYINWIKTIPVEYADDRVGTYVGVPRSYMVEQARKFMPNRAGAQRGQIEQDKQFDRTLLNRKKIEEMFPDSDVELGPDGKFRLKRIPKNTERDKWESKLLTGYENAQTILAGKDDPSQHMIVDVKNNPGDPDLRVIPRDKAKRGHMFELLKEYRNGDPPDYQLPQFGARQPEPASPEGAPVPEAEGMNFVLMERKMPDGSISRRQVPEGQVPFAESEGAYIVK